MAKKTPENAVKATVKKLIEEICTRRQLPFEIDWHAGSAFTNTLDATGVIAGHPIIIEVKRMDQPESPTARQKIKMQRFRNAGAMVHDIVDPTSLNYLRYWLETLQPREPHVL